MNRAELNNLTNYFNTADRFEDGNSHAGSDGEIVMLTDTKVAKVYKETLSPEGSLYAGRELRSRYNFYLNILPRGTLPFIEFIIINNRFGAAQIVLVMDYIKGVTTSQMDSSALKDIGLVKQWNNICDSLLCVYFDLLEKGIKPDGKQRLPIIESGSGLWHPIKKGYFTDPFEEVPKSRNILVDTDQRIRLFDLGPLNISAEGIFQVQSEQYWSSGDDGKPTRSPLFI